MSHKSITYIKVPQRYGQMKSGVEKACESLEKLGLKSIFDKTGLPIKTFQITEPHGNQEYVDGLRGLSQCISVNVELRDVISKEYSNNNLIVNIGGDHSIGLGSIAGVMKSMNNKKQQPKVGVVWFDAHPDMNIPTSSPTGNIHGMPLACCVGKGDKRLTEICPIQVQPSDIMFVGIRSIDNEERGTIIDNNIDAFTAEEVNKIGMKKVVENLKEKFKNYDVVHLSFDIDGIEPKSITGTGTPVEGGVTLEDTLYFLKEIRTLNSIHSVDFVEYNPEIEEKMTGINVLKCIQTFLGSEE
ncbi:Arginase [Entamoeba marina]